MEAFDPFNVSDNADGHLFAASTVSPPSSAPSSPNISFNIKPLGGGEVKGKASPPKVLLPKMDVKLNLHEEVTSKTGKEGMMEIFVEGKLMAHVQSSIDTIPPFTLQISSPPSSECDIIFQNYCTVQSEHKTQNKHRSITCKVEIPKPTVNCLVLRYTMTTETKNMPILVQSKATLKEKICRVGIQIRSNLSNRGDINDLSISVPIPNTLQESSVKITRGKGSWNECKRLVTWDIGTLAHGQSVLVSVEAEVSHTMAQLLEDDDLSSMKFNEKIHCPVLVRCSSISDTLTDFTISASPWMEEPSNMSLQQGQSYRLLHRIPTWK